MPPPVFIYLSWISYLCMKSAKRKASCTVIHHNKASASPKKPVNKEAGCCKSIINLRLHTLQLNIFVKSLYDSLSSWMSALQVLIPLTALSWCSMFTINNGELLPSCLSLQRRFYRDSFKVWIPRGIRTYVTMRQPVFPRSGVLVLGGNSIQSLVPSTIISQVESLLDSHRIEDAVDLADQRRKKLEGTISVDEDEASYRMSSQTITF